MARSLLSPLVVLLPLIALFSGMAITPLLILFALTAAITARRQLFNGVSDYNNILKYIALLLLWPLATTLWSITPEHSASTSLHVIILCLIGLTAFHGTKFLPPLSPKTIDALAITVALVGLILLLERLLPHGLIYYIQTALGKDYERFMNKNINRGLCALTVFVWPLMLALYQKQQVKKSWLVMAMLFVGIMAMHSLSAKVGLIAGIVAFFAIRHWPLLAPRAIALLLPLALAAFVPLFILAEHTLLENDAVFEMLFNHLPLSSLHRLGIWHTQILYAQEHWLLGWGMDATRALPMTPEELKALGLTEPPLHPHSPSLQILVEQGIIGLMLSVAGLALLLRQWQRMLPGDAKAAAGALIVSYFVTGISSFGIWQSWWIATLWLAAMLWRYVQRR